MLPIIDTYRDQSFDHRKERIVFVGDIHGMYAQYVDLLEEIKPDHDTTIVLLGDFIYKGPQSREVLERVVLNDTLPYKLECILGNHEISILFALLNPTGLKRFNRMKMGRKKKLGSSEWNPIDFTSERYIPNHSKISKKHKEMSQSLGWDLLNSMADKCSAMWRFNSTDGPLSLVAVHAGIVPTALNNPQLKDITNMKWVDKDDYAHTSRDSFKNSVRWYQLWKSPKKPNEHVIVHYGHDAAKGLNIREHTKGLDSGCVGGGSLSALEYIWNDHTEEFDQYLYQVPCS